MAKKKLEIIEVRHVEGVLMPLDEESVGIVSTIPDGEDVLLELKHFTKKELRSIAANRLMWAWFKDAEKTKANEYAGWLSDEWHQFMKRKFLLVIYERDSIAWGETMEALRNVYRYGLKTEAEKLLDGIVKNEVSTTDATPEQFCEYLSSIERFFHDAGIYLRTDPRMYAVAFGID